MKVILGILIMVIIGLVFILGVKSIWNRVQEIRVKKKQNNINDNTKKEENK